VRSAWSVGILMVAMGGLSVGGIGMQRQVSLVGWALAGLLIVSGALLFLRRPFVYWLALAASILTAATGAIALLGRPSWALPVPPGLSIGVGIYLGLRVMMAKAAQPRRGFLPRSDEADQADQADQDRPE
jgi:hypothetical protein